VMGDLGEGDVLRCLCVWSLEGSLGARTVHDKRPNGVTARTRAPNATHTDVRDTRVHQTHV